MRNRNATTIRWVPSKQVFCCTLCNGPPASPPSSSTRCARSSTASHGALSSLRDPAPFWSSPTQGFSGWKSFQRSSIAATPGNTSRMTNSLPSPLPLPAVLATCPCTTFLLLTSLSPPSAPFRRNHCRSEPKTVCQSLPPHPGRAVCV